MSNIQPRDIIAILTLVSAILARIVGIASEVDALVTVVIGFYVAQRMHKTQYPQP